MTVFDSSIIGIYLLFMIIVGVFAGRGVVTMSDFAVGNRNFLTLTLVMTIFATYIDGECILNGTTQSFKTGISFFVVSLSAPISLFIYSFIANRVSLYKDAISVGDLIHKMYGKNAQIITGVSGFLISAALVAAQFKALSFVFDYFYKINSTSGVLLSAGILIAYSAFGGVRAVTWTDVVQFFILVNAIPLVTSVALNKVGGIFNLFEHIDPSKLSLLPPDKETAYKYLVYFIAVVIPLCSPPMIQRMLMTKNMIQSRKAYWVCALLCVPLYVIIATAGMTAFALNPGIDENNVFLYLVDTGMPSGFKGFAVAGIIAIIMSTADSFMNTAAISFAHDVYKTMKGDTINDKAELQLTKIATLLIGIVGCIIALRFDNLLDIMLYSYVLWGPVVTIPLLAGLFGIKAPRYAFYFAMTAGVLTSVIWSMNNMEAKTYIHDLLPALLMNIIFFFGCVIYDRLTNKSLTNHA